MFLDSKSDQRKENKGIHYCTSGDLSFNYNNEIKYCEENGGCDL